MRPRKKTIIQYYCIGLLLSAPLAGRSAFVAAYPLSLTRVNRKETLHCIGESGRLMSLQTLIAAWSSLADKQVESVKGALWKSVRMSKKQKTKKQTKRRSIGISCRYHISHRAGSGKKWWSRIANLVSQLSKEDGIIGLQGRSQILNECVFDSSATK